MTACARIAAGLRHRMARSARAALAAVAFGCGTATGADAPLTFLANEGVLLRAGDTAVVIDALFRAGVPGYATVTPAGREALESGRPPFDRVTLALATHAHADHFDAGAVKSFLSARPAARFVSTPQAVTRLQGAFADRVTAVLPAEGERRRLEFPGITVTAVNLHHGRGRSTENLGFIVEAGGRRVLHVGDTEASGDELAALGLAADRIDDALLPFWLLLDDDAEARVRAIGARRLAAIHVPAADAPPGHFGPPGSLPALRAALEARWPGIVLPPPR